MKPTSEDPKAAAWTKAKTAIDVWSFCLRFDADQRAYETTEAVQSVAQKVVEACAGLEQAVYEPLKAVGESIHFGFRRICMHRLFRMRRMS